MNEYTFATVVLMLALLVGLALLAWHGNVAAGVVLGAVVAATLIGLGVILSLVASWAAAKREQAHFAANAKENLAIMAAMQRVQNAQNAMLLKQAREAQKMLPQPDGDVLDVDALVFSDDVFAELEG